MWQNHMLPKQLVSVPVVAVATVGGCSRVQIRVCAACQQSIQQASAYHDSMLLRWVRDLHPSGTTNGWMRHISVAANLIGCVHNDNTFV